MVHGRAHIDVIFSVVIHERFELSSIEVTLIGPFESTTGEPLMHGGATGSTLIG